MYKVTSRGSCFSQAVKMFMEVYCCTDYKTNLINKVNVFCLAAILNGVSVLMNLYFD